jgi:hypothetical protein
MSTRAQFAALGAAAIVLPTGARAADPVRVNVNYFPGAAAMPLFYGIEHGFFDRAGLKVVAEATPSSTEQFVRLDRSAGLGPADVTYVAKGATGLRYRALLDGAFDATLLTPVYRPLISAGALVRLFVFNYARTIATVLVALIGFSGAVPVRALTPPAFQTFPARGIMVPSSR